MTDKKILLQFKSPWQGRNGFGRLELDPSSGDLTRVDPIDCERLMHKTAQNIDGIVLEPTWPTARRLCVLQEGAETKLYEIKGDKIDWASGGINIEDPSFKAFESEHLIFRTFTFSNDRMQIKFNDFSGALIGPYRSRLVVMPEYDFSPLGRMMRILENDKARSKFVSDLQKRRFKYYRWIDSKKSKFNWTRRVSVT